MVFYARVPFINSIYISSVFSIIDHLLSMGYVWDRVLVGNCIFLFDDSNLGSS